MKALSFAALLALAGALTASAQSGISNVVNLSARGSVGVQSGYLTAGFIISGPVAKSVLIRAVGPGLAPLGVGGTAAAVSLQLFDGNGALVAANDGYQSAANAAAIVSTAAGLYAFPLSASGDSAVLVTLAPGAYTVQGLPGAADVGTGTALVEVYDADVLAGGSPSTLIANMSAFGQVGQGSSALTLGFVIGGNESEDVYLHAVGPDLTAYGIANAASGVGITIYDGTGNLIDSNTGFFNAGNSGNMQVVSSDLGDMALSNANDSALIETLSPGSYSVMVSPSSGNSGSGVALVEAFDLDASVN